MLGIKSFRSSFCDRLAHLVVLGDYEASPARFEWHLLHGAKHVCPLQILGILWIDGQHILVVHWDAWTHRQHPYCYNSVALL